MYDSVNKVELTDIIEVHTLELCKIPAEADNSRLCYWMEFIKAEGEIELEAVAERDPLIKKAVARLMELSADEKTRPAVIEIAGIFRSRVIDVSPSTITVEATGDIEKLDGLLLLLRPYGILELARTGLVALERGTSVLSV